MTKPEDEKQTDEEFISKSQIKRECHALTDVGVELLTLSNDQLDSIPMADTLRNALAEAKNIRKHSALKRQRLYIGKLIRKDDCQNIQAHLEKIKEPSQQQNSAFKAMEDWRDRMLLESDQAVNDFIGQYHSADRQKLRQLVKNAIKERNLNQTPAQARKLFKYIRETIENDTESL